MSYAVEIGNKVYKVRTVWARGVLLSSKRLFAQAKDMVADGGGVTRPVNYQHFQRLVDSAWAGVIAAMDMDRDPYFQPRDEDELTN